MEFNSDKRGEKVARLVQLVKPININRCCRECLSTVFTSMMHLDISTGILLLYHHGLMGGYIAMAPG